MVDVVMVAACPAWRVWVIFGRGGDSLESSAGGWASGSVIGLASGWSSGLASGAGLEVFSRLFLIRISPSVVLGFWPGVESSGNRSR